jgi:hypothetical protein
LGVFAGAKPCVKQEEAVYFFQQAQEDRREYVFFNSQRQYVYFGFGFDAHSFIFKRPQVRLVFNSCS